MYIDLTVELCLPDGVKQALEESLEESDTCEGTGFYAILSCANHSCNANASVECKESSQINLVAQQPIIKGNEICINYIGKGLNLQEREQALQDYGFVCQCQCCHSEREERLQS